MSRQDAEFERICREEYEAGATVVVAKQRSLAATFHDVLMRKSKEELVDMYNAQVKYHNQFCAQADEWRKGLHAVTTALRPFADRIDELEKEASEALEVGGYVPLEEDAESPVPNRLLFAARKAIQQTPAKHTRDLSEAMRGARICIAAMKAIADSGNHHAAKIASDALAEVRKIDPYI